MAEETMTCKEHEEFHREYARRVDAEDDRQNTRITLLEESAKQLNTLAISIERLSVNMENVLTKIDAVDDRIKKLEEEPAENHKQIKMAIITAIISTAVGAVIGALIMIL